jgi:signal transduction histidine kinase
MLQRVAGPEVDVRLESLVAGTAGALTLRTDPGQFEQLFLNLTANARDAMPGGGTLRISCSLEEERRTSPRVSTLKKGSYLAISVTDTGAGIPLDVIDHVFEPFFTTKGASGGSGLGLATAFAYVQHAGGLLTVASRERVGTTFTIRLPVNAPARGR